MSEDKSFNKFVAICQIIGVLFGLSALYVYVNGIPNLTPMQRYEDFCYNEGGNFWERTRDTYNTDLCSFSFGDYYSLYAVDEITNEERAEAMDRTVGELCFVCWDSRSCTEDSLTKLDNGTRRDTRC